MDLGYESGRLFVKPPRRSSPLLESLSKKKADLLDGFSYLFDPPYLSLSCRDLPADTFDSA